MTGFEVYALAIGGPVLLILGIVAGFCQAAKGADYEDELLAARILAERERTR